MNPFVIAAKGKGLPGALKRARAIGGRYGFTTGKMDRAMAHFMRILREHGGRATFPIVAASLARSNGFADRCCAENIELAVHGFTHIDHTQLSLREQIEHFSWANRRFEQKGLHSRGFRSPYLRWNQDTIQAVTECGYLYDSSQGLAWDVVAGYETEAYRHVLKFYRAVSASVYPGLPRWDQGLVRIPYGLPDDEALIDRLRFDTPEQMDDIWLAILEQTHRLGELFTLGLHPERIFRCENPLIATLRRARELRPVVWFARLDEIAQWWKTHLERVVDISQKGDDEIELSFDGSPGTTLLARHVEVRAHTVAWDGIYQRVTGTTIRFQAARRPFIGVSYGSAPYLVSFLTQQGYIIEPAADGQSHAFFVDRSQFGYGDERPLLAEIETSDFPLVRFGRWPDGARSALSITGDIDALTIWDYLLRWVKK